jgi:hypothetical protein
VWEDWSFLVLSVPWRESRRRRRPYVDFSPRFLGSFSRHDGLQLEPPPSPHDELEPPPSSHVENDELEPPPSSHVENDELEPPPSSHVENDELEPLPSPP